MLHDAQKAEIWGVVWVETALFCDYCPVQELLSHMIWPTLQQHSTLTFINIFKRFCKMQQDGQLQWYVIMITTEVNKSSVHISTV